VSLRRRPRTIDLNDRRALRRLRGRRTSRAQLEKLRPQPRAPWGPGQSGNWRGPAFGRGRGETDRQVGLRPTCLAEDQVRAGVEAAVAEQHRRADQRARRQQARAELAALLRSPTRTFRFLAQLAAEEEREERTLGSR